MIVVDTSVAVAALLGHEPARLAITDQRLVAPHVIDAEVADALRGLVRGATLTAVEGEQLVVDWTQLVIDRLPMAPLLRRVWELRDNLSAYDALFVAAAEMHDFALVTADRRLTAAPGLRCRVELIPSH